jgi:CheY-like chemotaxis protein
MTQKVLLADASQTIRALARLTLSSEPVELLTAASGRQALDLIRSERPAVVVADARLPDIDGYQLCRLAREREPGLRFVLLSPEYLPVDEALAAEVGVSASLRKPFDRRTLLGALGRDAGAASSPGAVAGPLRPAAPPTGAAPGPDPAALVAAALPALVERLLPGLVEAALQTALSAALPRLLDERLRALFRERFSADGDELRALVEPVVWKTVPALAEQLIKEELKRLTDEVEER